MSSSTEPTPSGWFRVLSSPGNGSIVSFLVPDLLARRSEQPEPQPDFMRRP